MTDYSLLPKPPKALENRIIDRFGHWKYFDDAMNTLKLAKEETKGNVTGFVSKATSSLLAEIVLPHGAVGLCKIPLIDPKSTIQLIADESDNQSGPTILKMGKGYVVMEILEGAPLNPENLTPEIINWLVERSRTRDKSPFSLNLPYWSQRTMHESALRGYRFNEGEEANKKLVRLLKGAVKESKRTLTVQCHGDLDMRNIFDQGDSLMLIDPEPVIAPIEFEVAKILYSSQREDLIHSLDSYIHKGLIRRFMEIFSLTEYIHKESMRACGRT